MDPESSQEQAFDPKDLVVSQDVFKFDESEEKTPAPQAETEEKKEVVAVTPSTEEKEAVEEQRVPYSRFKKKVDEADENKRLVETLEARLSKLESNRQESKSEEMPQEWIDLYGNNDLAKKAWEVQSKREIQIQERAIKEALKLVKDEAAQAKKHEVESEEAITEYLSSLQETLGDTKLTKKLEEEILTIVDEFSPTDSEGKYVSLISPDKAFEIYNLRNQKKAVVTKKAREQVADLTSGKTEGEVDSASTHYEPSWDNWRKAI